MMDEIQDTIFPIEDALHIACSKHITMGNRNPTAMFLGNYEHKLLLNLMNDRKFFWKEVPENGQKRRLEWCGMEVYRVDDISYVGFGSTPFANKQKL